MLEEKCRTGQRCRAGKEPGEESQLKGEPAVAEGPGGQAGTAQPRAGEPKAMGCCWEDWLLHCAGHISQVPDPQGPKPGQGLLREGQGPRACSISLQGRARGAKQV